MIQQASLFGFPVSIIIAAFYLFLKWEWSWGWVVDIMLLKSRQWLSQRTCFFFASPSPNHCVRILSHCWQNSSEKNQLVSYFPIVHDKQGSILKACPSAYYNIVKQALTIRTKVQVDPILQLKPNIIYVFIRIFHWAEYKFSLSYLSNASLYYTWASTSALAV